MVPEIQPSIIANNFGSTFYLAVKGTENFCFSYNEKSQKK